MDYNEDLKNRLPELKKIEGFPIGSDEDILALSKPPYYTACPNPYIADFIKEHGKPYHEASDDYHREPFAGDVSEGKNDPIYNAHSYHTKVPHKAIMKYIEHYTDEGDIVLDGFCGTGMTGVAGSELNRKSILLDLAPISTFISWNYNSLYGQEDFLSEYNRIYNEVQEEYGWVYLTKHLQTQNQHELLAKDNNGNINYVVWSDIFSCPYCKHEFDYYSVDQLKDESKSFACPSCKAHVKKDECTRVQVSVFDQFLSKNIRVNLQKPVLINYTFNKKRFEKVPDEDDIRLLNNIEDTQSAYWLPIYKMLFKDDAWGDIYRTGYHFGMTHTHHFYTKRNLLVLGAFWAKTSNFKVKWAITSILNYVNKRQSYSGGGGGMPGVLFVASLVQEKNVFDVLKRKVAKLSVLLNRKQVEFNSIISTQSVTDLANISNDSIDYIFTDPPFGDNIMYSEASFLWESWLKVFTSNKTEAIINNSQLKKLDHYRKLIFSAFKEYYRVIKPKRWITIEFHNSKSSIWNAIQDSILRAGFIIAKVSVLDKQQGSFKQVTSAGAVEKDLVISAYKPSLEFTNRFLAKAGSNLEADFIKQFLSQLPIQPSIERTEKMLYSKMLSFYIQHGYEVNMDAKTFYKMLNTVFVEQDGLWFTSEQISMYSEYKKKMKLEGIDELKSGSMFLFVTDEKSSLVWLYNFLTEARSFSDIHTAFTQLVNIQGDNVPELRELLEQNFIFENDKYRRPKSEPEHSQISDKREKALLREFESLLIKTKTEKGKIKLVRKEALLFGFETCYKTRRYQDILTVTNKLDKSIIENSSELNDFVEAAEIMIKGME